MKCLHNLFNSSGGFHEKTFFRTFVVLMGIAVLFGTAVLTSAQDNRQIGGVGITVFVDRNFRGLAQTFQQDTPDLRPFGLDDRISSLAVARDEQWEVCDGVRYSGRCLIVSGQVADLRSNNWDDKIRSFRRTRGNPTPGPGGEVYIVLFTQTNFRGTPRNFRGPEANLDRSAQSVTIGGGTWQLCDGRNFSGRCVTLNQSVADLNRYNMRGRVSSARPLSPPTNAEFYVVLFDRENFTGNPTNFSAAQTDISINARSATIGNGNWELCDGRNYTGRCVTISQNVPNLAILHINRRIRSLRPLVRQPR